MLKREFKLKNSEEIKQVLKLGRKIRGSYLTLFTLASSGAHCQAAVVISRKVAGGAVMRNRVRRIIFADLESRLKDWADRGVGAMVVMVMSIPKDEKLLLTDLAKCFASW